MMSAYPMLQVPRMKPHNLNHVRNASVIEESFFEKLINLKRGYGISSNFIANITTAQNEVAIS